ncbi:MAG: Asp-tRNA(Asn)/Glu-tRNA(Gln) amidotransferase subunit GatB [Verrucomicrobia bacterium]|nr:MAG: Asp-tRNA(Asn)/Glu-tRNA(Gln) amidotransferase subunit GatB [Verrucomicrobiota bacterium]TAE88919.1 MAG: Asp-tRNA(Asn)/Glu-tRNA(Gln) amidotransferase subunit GatB [Verrucomicrobiota bacterium]TAF27335.1 MAG: Asp-tRNA(Asn)/Glu-tRNA(Gln) amidotransferase subunit GatB [Verrucomicrobiota bacterium]TAF42374.1 MAG: Asp-tRNA(Asn)/Glu-tRNA(Gln) amidotransferase subunit GatB [Verrucomicrobiota bacterium]
MSYLVTIGLEVHCQVKTRTKMFCACETSFGGEPNTRTCPVCLGLPGALPVLNRHAIEKTLLAGLLLDCGSPEISQWDRKNYFYPDMPKNYQTTQMDSPLCLGGEVPVYDFNYPTDARKNIPRPGLKVRLNRIHLEEDVAKSTHLGTSSVIDYNRAGTPLMEIVTEPDIESSAEAFAFLRSLQMILQQGGISDADMEKGQLRCDVNISIRRRPEDPYGNRIELKNLNSISAVRRSIDYEIARQSDELAMGIDQIQSTRRWDDDRGESQLLRTKEDAHDYRYFPCPDLLPVHTAPLLEKVRPLLTERPHERAARYEQDFGVTTYDASVFAADLPLAHYFEAILGTGALNPKKTSNFLLNTLLGTLNERSIAIADSPLPAAKTAALLGLVEAGTLALSQAKEVLSILLDAPDRDPAAIAKELGFEPADAGELDALCDQVIAANPDKVAEIKAGNEKLLNWLTGQVMKASTSKPNPKQVTDLLKGKLG